MRHIVVGQGNLGWDLTKALSAREEDLYIVGRTSGWEWPGSQLDDMIGLKPDVVWLCVGHGGTAEANMDYSGAVSTHVGLPVDCLMRFPEETKIILFSSDHCANEKHPSNPNLHTLTPRSLFTLSKLSMENAFWFIGRPNSAVVRLGSLYGDGRPSRSFPGRLLAHNTRPCTVPIPSNFVTPTPTEWLAETLIRRIDAIVGGAPRCVHLAPSGSVSLPHWARLILGPKFDIEERPPSPDRPIKVGLGCSIGPTPDWRDLWDRIGKKNFNIKH